MNPPEGCVFHPRCQYRVEDCERVEPEIKDIGARHYVACHSEVKSTLMLNYIVRRIIYLVPVLFVMSIVVFSFMHFIPGDPVEIMLGIEATERAKGWFEKRARTG